MVGYTFALVTVIARGVIVVVNTINSKRNRIPGRTSMSRTNHKLVSSQWYGDWAAFFHKENRELRRRGREKRRKMVAKQDLEYGLDWYASSSKDAPPHYDCCEECGV